MSFSIKKTMEKFHSLLLFRRKGTIQISFLEIARTLGVSERTAKRYIKKDLESGLIRKETTQYQCRKYKVPLTGRNIYHLTEKGKTTFNLSNKGSLTPQSFITKKYSSKEEFAKGHPRVDFSKIQEEKKRVLEKYNFLHLQNRAPHWWFRELPLLEKTLKLLSQKKKRGYRVKNEERWISRVIRDQGRGYRHKIAKRCALVLANNRKEVLRVVEDTSEKVLSGFDQLKELKKRGLNTSFAQMEKLLRKGFAHLALSSEVLLKVLKKSEIQNIDAFLNWLVSLQDPMEVFKRKAVSTLEKIAWAKTLFKNQASRCVFDKQGSFNRWLQKRSHLDQEKVFVQFHVYENLESSFVRTLHWVSGKWEDRRLPVNRVSFQGDLKAVFERG